MVAAPTTELPRKSLGAPDFSAGCSWVGGDWDNAMTPGFGRDLLAGKSTAIPQKPWRGE
ncbi:hypothetical protein GCM10027180_25370 [Microbulbifer echini]